MKKIILGILLVGTLAQAAEQLKEKSNTKWWLLGGTAVAGVVAVGASGGGSSDDEPEAPKAPIEKVDRFKEVDLEGWSVVQPTEGGDFKVYTGFEETHYRVDVSTGMVYHCVDNESLGAETTLRAEVVEYNGKKGIVVNNIKNTWEHKGGDHLVLVEGEDGNIKMITTEGERTITKDANNTQALQDAKEGLNQAMDRQNETINKQFAMNQATITAQTSALAELDKKGDVAVGVGVGGTGDDTAVSMSVAMKPTENTNLNANVTTTTDGEETSFGIGGGIKLGNMFK